MAEGVAEWELCKENGQLLGEGRAGTSLPQEGSSQTAIQQQRRSFELELRTYTGEDPLDVWDRYIRWVLQTYPQGGKESNLGELLQRSVLQLVNEKKYHDDARYVNLWIKLAQNSDVPGDTFSYMQGQGVGLAQAALYIAWSEEFEKHGDIQKADAVLQEGLECGAQPVDKLQQYQKALRARVSFQANRVQEEEEPGSPLRTSMVDLRPRGKRRRPVSGAENSVTSHTGGLNLPLRRSTRNAQSATVILDESQSGPSMGSDVEMPPTCSDSTLAMPPNKANFLPFTEESDQAPSVSVWNMEPAANMVLSDRQPPKEEPTLEHLQSQEAGGVKEQSMYCKDLLMRGIIEFSIEELRAERYFQCKRQEYKERSQHLAEVREQLRKELEEKQRLVLLRQSQQLQPPVAEQDGSMAETGSPMLTTEPDKKQQHTMSFQILDESQSGSVSTQPSGNPHPGQNDLPDDVFLHPGERGLCLRIQYPRQGGHMPLPEQSHMYKSFPERTESLNEEHIIYSHQNKTLCSSPDDTNDFARAEKLASTPCTGLLSQRTSSPDTGGLTEDLCVLAKTAPTVTPQDDSHKKLSPIQEASLEAWSSIASATTSLSSQGAQSAGKVGHLSCLEESRQEPDVMDHNSSPTDCLREDPCTLDVRRLLLDQIHFGAFPNFHSLPAPIPTVEEDSVLLLGSEIFLIYSKVADGENFSIYTGIANQADVVMKVENSTVPWDFYIGCQLRQRLAADPLAPAHPDISCYAFHNGCVTVYKVTQQLRVLQMDHELLVVCLAIHLLELVRSMHSCSLLLGALPPHTLLTNTNSASSEVESILAVDLSSSVDLQLQPGVTSARQLASAWPFIDQGLLEPSASPFQVDLLAVAETIHTLLTQSSMHLIKDDSGWTVEFSEAKPRGQRMVLWRKFFQTLLNPSDKPSVSILSELRDMLTAYAA